MSETKRNLNADLAICNAATPGPWVIATTTDDTFVLDKNDLIVSASERHEDARFIAEARTGWPHAIERAMAAERKLAEAEAEVERLLAEIEQNDETEQPCIDCEGDYFTDRDEGGSYCSSCGRRAKRRL
jgi:hypothetical protein